MSRQATAAGLRELCESFDATVYLDSGCAISFGKDFTELIMRRTIDRISSMLQMDRI